MATVRTQVGIVGAGPAGLLLAHLLGKAGIECVVLEGRTREQVESTIRAGILEQGTVELLSESGASDRVLTVGSKHEGIELRFDGAGHRIDFTELVGRAVWLYPQHEVLIDLIARLLDDEATVLFDHEVDEVVDAESETPRILARDAQGEPVEIAADFVIGADGSRSVARTTVTGSPTGGYFREYPFAWFGILCEAPPSSHELIYSSSPEGFALISQRTPQIQRMYLQCDPELDPESMSEEQIWDSLQRRVEGTELQRGHIFQRDVLRFRSFVAHALRRGRVFLAGDAAHTVPPTGAKGMNLAVADVRLLEEGILAHYAGDPTLLDHYEAVALQRIRKAQHYSWWMTSMLHSTPDATDFDRLRQLGELETLVDSRAGRAWLAEGYTGWEHRSLADAAR